MHQEEDWLVPRMAPAPLTEAPKSSENPTFVLPTMQPNSLALGGVQERETGWILPEEQHAPRTTHDAAQHALRTTHDSLQRQAAAHRGGGQDIASTMTWGHSLHDAGQLQMTSTPSLPDYVDQSMPHMTNTPESKNNRSKSTQSLQSTLDALGSSTWRYQEQGSIFQLSMMPPQSTEIAAFDAQSEMVAFYARTNQSQPAPSWVHFTMDAPMMDNHFAIRAHAGHTLSERANAFQVKPRIRRRKIGEGDKYSLGGRPLNDIDDMIPIAFTP